MFGIGISGEGEGSEVNEGGEGGGEEVECDVL